LKAHVVVEDRSAVQKTIAPSHGAKHVRIDDSCCSSSSKYEQLISAAAVRDVDRLSAPEATTCFVRGACKRKLLDGLRLYRMMVRCQGGFETVVRGQRSLECCGVNDGLGQSLRERGVRVAERITPGTKPCAAKPPSTT